MITNLYRHFDKDGNLLYIGISLSAIARLKQHQMSAWVDDIATVKIEKFTDRDSAIFAEKSAIKLESPMYNKQHKLAIIKENDFECVEEVFDFQLFLSSWRNSQFLHEFSTKSQALKLFGGNNKLAKALGKTPGAVSQWPEEMPMSRINEVIGCAVRMGIAIPDELKNA